MRIAIITLPLHINYGGILQAYALQTVLANMGHDANVVYSPHVGRPKHLFRPLHLIYRCIKRYVFHKQVIIRYEWFRYKQYKRYMMVSKNIQPFIDKYIHKYYGDALYMVVKGDFDCFVVGSDQIWRPLYAHQIERAFLDYTETWDIKRIAYAASFGVDKWEYTQEQTEHCKQLIEQFDAVSVREESGVKLCKDNFDIDAQWLLDPTMLLDKADYIKLMQKASLDDEPLSKIVTYILDSDESNTSLSNYIADSKGMKIYRLPGDPYNVMNSIDENNSLPSIETWLNALYKAELVFTDSFHGCVFSIIFNKPFYVYKNEIRGNARINSLLHLYGLESRIINSSAEYDKVKEDSIDWDRVNTIHSTMKNKSSDFLLTVLSN